MKKYVGIDIGGTAVKSAIVGEDGKIYARSSVPTLATRPYTEVAADIAKQILALSDGVAVEGVGIGCPGAIDSERGFVNYSNNLYWKNVPLADELRKYVKAPIRISNDATWRRSAKTVSARARNTQTPRSSRSARAWVAALWWAASCLKDTAVWAPKSGTW